MAGALVRTMRLQLSTWAVRLALLLLAGSCTTAPRGPDAAAGNGDGAAVAPIDAATDVPSGDARDSAQRDAPTDEVLRVPLLVTGFGDRVDRLYVPATHELRAALLLLDTGAATSFLYLGAGAPPWTPAAGEVEIAGKRLLLGGRDFPRTTEQGQPVVGTLGADLLLGATSPAADSAELDLRCGVLDLHFGAGPAETAGSPGAWPEALFDDVQGHVIVPVTLEGEALRLMLDTGAQDLLWLGKPGRPGDEVVQTTDAVGNVLTLYLGEGTLELASDPPRAVPVLRAPSFPYFEETVRLLGGGIHGLLGLSSIKGRTLGFARGRTTVRLEPLDSGRTCP